jgi:hypothetical protein
MKCLLCFLKEESALFMKTAPILFAQAATLLNRRLDVLEIFFAQHGRVMRHMSGNNVGARSYSE